VAQSVEAVVVGPAEDDRRTDQQPCSRDVFGEHATPAHLKKDFARKPGGSIRSCRKMKVHVFKGEGAGQRCLQRDNMRALST